MVQNGYLHIQIRIIMILTKKRFAEAIEKVVLEKGLNYIDAIIYYCEKEHLDPESVKNLITPPLKEKIEVDAMSYIPFMHSRYDSA